MKLEDNAIYNKSLDFAIRIVNLYKYMNSSKNEFIISKQLLRSGTSIGANVREAVRAQSKPDFISKMNIALKEADETSYWLELLYKTGYLTEPQFNSINKDCDVIIRILVKIIKTSK